jgi:hypothetical protein
MRIAGLHAALHVQTVYMAVVLQLLLQWIVPGMARQLSLPLLSSDHARGLYVVNRLEALNAIHLGHHASSKPERKA